MVVSKILTCYRNARFEIKIHEPLRSVGALMCLPLQRSVPPSLTWPHYTHSRACQCPHNCFHSICKAGSLPWSLNGGGLSSGDTHHLSHAWAYAGRKMNPLTGKKTCLWPPLFWGLGGESGPSHRPINAPPPSSIPSPGSDDSLIRRLLQQRGGQQGLGGGVRPPDVRDEQTYFLVRPSPLRVQLTVVAEGHLQSQAVKPQHYGISMAHQ